MKAQARAVGEHLRRTTGREWDVAFDDGGNLRLRPRWPEGPPMVSAIIAIRRGEVRTRRLIDRLRAAKCEVILAQGSGWVALNQAAARATGDALLFIDED